MLHEMRRLFHPRPISFQVPLSPRLLKWSSAGPTLGAAILDSRPSCFTFSGTAAIYQAAQVLSLQPGDQVLCPAYNCGHEIEPLIRSGLGLDFYAVGSDLLVDLHEVERKIHRRTRAVLVTHYFGFPQPLSELRKLCRHRGISLIEDCAHGLFSRGPEGWLGATGDVAIFSLRKTIPLPNGGALLVNREDLRLPARLERPPWGATWSKVAALLRKWLLQRFAPLPLRPLRLLATPFDLLPLGVSLLQRLGVLPPLASWDPDDEDFEFEDAVLGWEMAEVGHYIAGNVNAAVIVARRRENFRLLLEGVSGIAGCQPVFSSLPPGVCPLYFPLLVTNRDQFIHSLHRRAITAAKWWETFHGAVPWDRFPVSIRLKEQMVALPVHQYLTREDMCRMVEAVQVQRRRLAGSGSDRSLQGGVSATAAVASLSLPGRLPEEPKGGRPWTRGG